MTPFISRVISRVIWTQCTSQSTRGGGHCSVAGTCSCQMTCARMQEVLLPSLRISCYASINFPYHTCTFRMPWGALMSFSSEAGIMKGICATFGLHQHEALRVRSQALSSALSIR